MISRKFSDFTVIHLLIDQFPSEYFDVKLKVKFLFVKVNACELLHAIVVFMIGKRQSEPQLNSDGSLSNSMQLYKLYQRVFPSLFKLACDADQFPRNLFQPLCMQIVHWFTGNRHYESRETVALLDCIMEGLVDETDAALRDFSAKALREFLKWSIKHTPLSRQDTHTSPVNVKSVLKRIFSFLNHPSSAKRLGAALAWNSIYTIFREEDSLVDKHIFELLYNLIESLALSEHDDKMYGTQEHAKLALDHVERIIKVKAEMLSQISSQRVKPPGWSEAVLEVAVSTSDGKYCLIYFIN